LHFLTRAIQDFISA